MRGSIVEPSTREPARSSSVDLSARESDMSTPRVSVIIPFHDSESFLDESIRSVVEQTFTDWELLLVDDRSSDASASIARGYATRDQGRIRCLEHEGRANRGVSASRNLGLRHARGEYVAFLDADDVWLPRKLEEQVLYMEQHPAAGLVYGRIGYWYSWTGDRGNANRDFEADMGVPSETLFTPPALAAAVIEGTARAPLPSDALLRGELLRTIGGFEEDRRFSIYEDRVFFVRVELAAAAYVADRCWVRYRQHELSSSATIDRGRRRAEARLAFLQWLERYLRANGYRGTAMWRSARQQAFAYQHPTVARAFGLLGGLPSRTGRRIARTAASAFRLAKSFRI